MDDLRNKLSYYNCAALCVGQQMSHQTENEQTIEQQCDNEETEGGEQQEVPQQQQQQQHEQEQQQHQTEMISENTQEIQQSQQPIQAPPAPPIIHEPTEISTYISCHSSNSLKRQFRVCEYILY